MSSPCYETNILKASDFEAHPTKNFIFHPKKIPFQHFRKNGSIVSLGLAVQLGLVREETLRRGTTGRPPPGALTPPPPLRPPTPLGCCILSSILAFELFLFHEIEARLKKVWLWRKKLEHLSTFCLRPSAKNQRITRVLLHVLVHLLVHFLI